MCQFARLKFINIKKICRSFNHIQIFKYDIGREMYFVESGICEVSVRSDVVMKLVAGQYFGELSILLSEKRAATVKTKTNTKLLSLSKYDLQVALKDFDKEASAIRREAKARSAEHAAEEMAKQRARVARGASQRANSDASIRSEPNGPRFTDNRASRSSPKACVGATAKRVWRSSSQ